MAKAKADRRAVKVVKTYNDIETHRTKGKDTCAIPDAIAKGLGYQRQGNSVFARHRVVIGTKRDSKTWVMPPLAEFIVAAEARGEAWPIAAGCGDAEKELNAVRDDARQRKIAAKIGKLPGGGGAATVSAAAVPASSRTVAELWAKYEKTELLKLSPKSIKSAKQYAARFVLPVLGARCSKDVTREEIAGLHSGLSATPYQANRVLSLISVLFTTAVEWGWRPDNPAKGRKLFKEAKRKDWYTEEELERLVTALEASAQVASARVILLGMFTGARPQEVLGATWAQFDLEAGTWTKPAEIMKTGEAHHVPLIPEAAELLRTMRAELGDDAKGLLFPGRYEEGKPMKDVGRTWDSVVKAAGVRRLRLYDLRHSFASNLANKGVSLVIIGGLLGHSQTKTTQRYAHLGERGLRAAAELFKPRKNGNATT